jgi:hypothetical protein
MYSYNFLFNMVNFLYRNFYSVIPFSQSKHLLSENFFSEIMLLTFCSFKQFFYLDEFKPMENVTLKYAFTFKDIFSM